MPSKGYETARQHFLTTIDETIPGQLNPGATPYLGIDITTDGNGFDNPERFSEHVPDGFDSVVGVALVGIEGQISGNHMPHYLMLEHRFNALAGPAFFTDVLPDGRTIMKWKLPEFGDRINRITNSAYFGLSDNAVELLYGKMQQLTVECARSANVGGNITMHFNRVRRAQEMVTVFVPHNAQFKIIAENVSGNVVVEISPLTGIAFQVTIAPAQSAATIKTNIQNAAIAAGNVGFAVNVTGTVALAAGEKHTIVGNGNTFTIYGDIVCDLTNLSVNGVGTANQAAFLTALQNATRAKPNRTTAVATGTVSQPTGGAPSIMVAGAGTADYNGEYFANGTYNGAVLYVKDSTHHYYWGGSSWYLGPASHSTTAGAFAYINQAQYGIITQPHVSYMANTNGTGAGPMPSLGYSSLVVSGAGDATYNGTYALIYDATAGGTVYKMNGSSRYISCSSDCRMSPGPFGAPQPYLIDGSVSHGNPIATWSLNNGTAPAPTVTPLPVGGTVGASNLVIQYSSTDGNVGDIESVPGTGYTGSSTPAGGTGGVVLVEVTNPSSTRFEISKVSGHVGYEISITNVGSDGSGPDVLDGPYLESTHILCYKAASFADLNSIKMGISQAEYDSPSGPNPDLTDDHIIKTAQANSISFESMVNPAWMEDRNDYAGGHVDGDKNITASITLPKDKDGRCEEIYATEKSEGGCSATPWYYRQAYKCGGYEIWFDLYCVRNQKPNFPVENNIAQRQFPLRRQFNPSGSCIMTLIKP